MLDTLTIVLMLAAGLLHASWHSLVKSGGDQILILSGMGVVACAAALCALPFLPFPTGQVWIVLAFSVSLHVGYKFALAQSYAFGDLGQAYPLARGLVPLISTAIAFVLLSQSPSRTQVAGIAIVSLGLMWLAVHSIRGGVDRRVFGAALVTGLTVASYSVLDAYGANLAPHWGTFAAWLVVLDTLAFLLLIRLARGRTLWAALWHFRWRMAASGLLRVTSFAVVMWALSRSPVGPVSALRESSVLFATIIGIAFFKEKPSAHRVGAALTIMTGLITISL